MTFNRETGSPFIPMPRSKHLLLQYVTLLSGYDLPLEVPDWIIVCVSNGLNQVQRVKDQSRSVKRKTRLSKPGLISYILQRKPLTYQEFQMELGLFYTATPCLLWEVGDHREYPPFSPVSVQQVGLCSQSSGQPIDTWKLPTRSDRSPTDRTTTAAAEAAVAQ